jgi:hypothetical protein
MNVLSNTMISNWRSTTKTTRSTTQKVIGVIGFLCSTLGCVLFARKCVANNINESVQLVGYNGALALSGEEPLSRLYPDESSRLESCLGIPQNNFQRCFQKLLGDEIATPCILNLLVSLLVFHDFFSRDFLKRK